MAPLWAASTQPARTSKAGPADPGSQGSKDPPKPWSTAGCQAVLAAKDSYAAAPALSAGAARAGRGAASACIFGEVEAASAIFDEQVIEPTNETATGVARLRAYIERFLDHVEEGVFPGGCFFVSAFSELDTHPGPVRDGAMAFSQRWLGLLAQEVAAGQAAGELDPGADPPQIAFELNAYMVLGNMQFVVASDPAALDRVRRAVDARLGALAAPA